MFCPGLLFSIGEEARRCCWIPCPKHVFRPDLHLQVQCGEEPADKAKSLESADWRCLLQHVWVGYEGASLWKLQFLKPGGIWSCPSQRTFSTRVPQRKISQSPLVLGQWWWRRTSWEDVEWSPIPAGSRGSRRPSQDWPCLGQRVWVGITCAV